jgi:hypothetical protein
MKIILAFALWWVNESEQRAFLREIVLWRALSPDARTSYHSPPQFRYVWRVRWVLAWAMVMIETPLLWAWFILSSMLLVAIILARWLS